LKPSRKPQASPFREGWINASFVLVVAVAGLESVSVFAVATSAVVVRAHPDCLWVRIWRGLQALQRPIVTGEDAMIGQRAVVIHADDGQHEVEYEGEIWRVVSYQPQSLGQQVVIKDVKGLILQVESLSQASQEE
jgi:membrane protein implicated in regulation of membrane protease activity